MKYYLYKIENLTRPVGEQVVYIGITNNPYQRYHQHKSQSHTNHCTLLKKAFRKYGEDNLEMVILKAGTNRPHLQSYSKAARYICL